MYCKVFLILILYKRGLFLIYWLMWEWLIIRFIVLLTKRLMSRLMI